MTETVTRAEAMARGLKRYFTGKSCKRNHIYERYVINFACVLCEHIAQQYPKAMEWREKNREKVRQYQKMYFENGTENPRSEKQWLRKNRTQLQKVLRLLKGKSPEALSKRKRASTQALNSPT